MSGHLNYDLVVPIIQGFTKVMSFMVQRSELKEKYLFFEDEITKSFVIDGINQNFRKATKDADKLFELNVTLNEQVIKSKFLTMGYVGLLAEVGGLMKSVHLIFFLATLVISRKLFMTVLLGRLFLANENKEGQEHEHVKFDKDHDSENSDLKRGD